jgi:uncharacterized protein (TIGR03086 family)
VKALLNHILGGGLMYAAVNAGEIASEDAGDVVGDDPTSAIADVARINLDSWRGAGALDGDRCYPWGTFPATAGLVINVSEVAVHAWDIAQATGQVAPRRRHERCVGFVGDRELDLGTVVLHCGFE